MMTFNQVLAIVFAICILPIMTNCCGTLPPSFYYNNVGYYLHQQTECKGEKIHEIQNVMDNEQCINACIYYQCAAINIFQLSEYGFMCEILATIIGTVPAQGAACYAPF